MILRVGEVDRSLGAAQIGFGATCAGSSGRRYYLELRGTESGRQLKTIRGVNEANVLCVWGVRVWVRVCLCLCVRVCVSRSAIR